MSSSDVDLFGSTDAFLRFHRAMPERWVPARDEEHRLEDEGTCMENKSEFYRNPRSGKSSHVSLIGISAHAAAVVDLRKLTGKLETGKNRQA